LNNTGVAVDRGHNLGNDYASTISRPNSINSSASAVLPTNETLV
jgi:hypothetical protein